VAGAGICADARTQVLTLSGMQTADQVADAIAWLHGDGAARLTGQVLAVEGGFATVRRLVKMAVEWLEVKARSCT